MRINLYMITLRKFIEVQKEVFVNDCKRKYLLYSFLHIKLNTM